MSICILTPVLLLTVLACGDGSGGGQITGTSA